MKNFLYGLNPLEIIGVSLSSLAVLVAIAVLLIVHDGYRSDAIKYRELAASRLIEIEVCDDLMAKQTESMRMNCKPFRSSAHHQLSSPLGRRK